MMRMFLFLLSLMVFAPAQSEDYLLKIKELKRLGSKQRNQYLRAVSKELIHLSPKARQSLIDLLLDRAHADSAFQCIGGGIPIPSGATCGTNAYAGYSCPEGQQICNPLLFGIYPSGEPVCFPRATTSVCYQNTRVGINTVTDPVYSNPEAQAVYIAFAEQVGEICTSLEGGGTSSLQIAENPNTLRVACRQVQRQTEINRQRNLMGFNQAPPSPVEGAPNADSGEVVADSPNTNPPPPPGDAEPSPDPAPSGASAGDTVGALDGSGPITSTPPVPGFTADPTNPCLAPQLTERLRGGGGPIPNLQNQSGTARDNQVLASVRAGHIPDFLRQLVPVRMPSSRQCQGQRGDIVICSMPDYLAVGNNTNYVHTPLGLPAATSIARELGFILPTTQMVDRIHAQATVRVAPSPRPPNAAMTSTSVFVEHSQAAQRDLANRQGLRAGHKKDLVITNRLSGNQFRSVAIYGWHRSGGNPIQPLYLGHEANYADYSHGIRLISQTAFINGQSVPLQTLLRDPNCAAALSNEGPLNNAVLNLFGPGAPAPVPPVEGSPEAPATS